MARIPHLRVIIETEPHSGEWNMAVDETLLESAISAGIATLRFYEWKVPTVSLGYFQKSADFIEDPILSRLPVVRRLSGGGAILHDDELTLSVTLPASQKLFRQPHEFYDIIHQPIIQVLNQLGFPVRARGETLKRADEPLLCFQRQDSHDITVLDHKILGSAQRRRRGAILQHGSLVRQSCPLAKSLPGLTDLCDASLPENLPELLTISIAEQIAVSWEIGFLTKLEAELTHQLSQQQSSMIRIR